MSTYHEAAKCWLGTGRILIAVFIITSSLITVTVIVQDLVVMMADGAESKTSLSAPKSQELNATCEALKFKLGSA